MAKKTALPTVRIAQLARHESGGYLAANLAVSDDGWNGLEPFDRPVRLGEERSCCAPAADAAFRST